MIFTERNQIVAALYPDADRYDSDPSTDIFDTRDYRHITFLLIEGAGGTGTCTITVGECDDTTPTNETAMPIITQNARRNSRNNARITRTMPTAMTAFFKTRFRRRRNSSALFRSIRHLTPGGRALSNPAMVSSTASATSMGDCDPTR